MDANDTTRVFITGASGFVGSQVVRVLQQEHPEYVLYILVHKRLMVDNIQSYVIANFEDKPTANINYIAGDMLQSDPNMEWYRAAAAATYIIHCAQPALTFRFPKSVFNSGKTYKQHRIQMDKNLLDCAATSKNLKCFVFVAGTSYYGEQGPEWKTEEATPNPRGFGPLIADSIQMISDVYSCKVPIVLAFPSSIYGNGSWFLGKYLLPIYLFSSCPSTIADDKYSSFMHVRDCARGLVWLMEHGVSGERYFLTDDEPIKRKEIVTICQNEFKKPVRNPYFPLWLLRIMAGGKMADSSVSECRLSNKKLRNLKFQLEFPTFKDGAPAVIKEFLGSSYSDRKNRGPMKVLLLTAIVVAFIAILFRDNK